MREKHHGSILVAIAVVDKIEWNGSIKTMKTIRDDPEIKCQLVNQGPLIDERLGGICDKCKWLHGRPGRLFV